MYKNLENLMIIELSGEYTDFKNNEEFLSLKEAENIAYQQLFDQLIKFGYKHLLINIGAEHADYLDGGLCLYNDGKYWLVYHSERYKKSALAIFSSPYSAANYYLWSVLADPSKESTSVGMIPKLGTF